MITIAHAEEMKTELTLEIIDLSHSDPKLLIDKIEDYINLSIKILVTQLTETVNDKLIIKHILHKEILQLLSANNPKYQKSLVNIGEIINEANKKTELLNINWME